MIYGYHDLIGLYTYVAENKSSQINPELLKRRKTYHIYICMYVCIFIGKICTHNSYSHTKRIINI
jgi:hypothetical protein